MNDGEHSAPACETKAGDHTTKGLLRLTMACNERCSFCNVPVEDYAVRTPPESLLRAQIEAFFDSGERTLTLSGGEPTLRRRRLLALVAEARQRGVPYVDLQTNAVLVDAQYARELAEAGLTSAFVSLLSHVPALHDELAGLPGAFEKCLSGIDALIAMGVRVNLNPVIAVSTQALVSEYVDFVAARFPRIGSISLSAVQPHGRARRNLHLIPNYAVLGPEVKRARRRAALHGLRIVNPYCGLPLCVGWDDEQQTSVEAFEAQSRRGASIDGVFGLNNRGDKSQRKACRDCALRTRCGGAWHEYYDVHAESGLAPPLHRIEPWSASAARSEGGQAVITAEDAPSQAHFAELGASTQPTVWLCAGRLSRGDAARLVAAGCSDLALRMAAAEFCADKVTLRELRQLQRGNAQLPPQARVRVVLGLVGMVPTRRDYQALQIAAALGLDAVRIRAEPQPLWTQLMAAAGAAHPELDVGYARNA
jgi:MoaA/NifB/PqqE/SkfB family radical SAM enzyme